MKTAVKKRLREKEGVLFGDKFKIEIISSKWINYTIVI